MRRAVLLLGIFVTAIAGFQVARHFLYSSVVTETGSAAGFAIGQSRAEAYESAKVMIDEGRAVAIQRWPTSRFERRRTFSTDEDPTADTSPTWSIVIDPEWWNNTVTLDFEEDRVVRIRRNRICCETP